VMPQIALFSAALSVLNNALTNEVRIEESWLGCQSWLQRQCLLLQ
jgi:hypothetical protein